MTAEDYMLAAAVWAFAEMCSHVLPPESRQNLRRAREEVGCPPGIAAGAMVFLSLVAGLLWPISLVDAVHRLIKRSDPK